MADKQQPEPEENQDQEPRKSLLRRFRPLILFAIFLAFLPSILTVFQWHRTLLNLAAPELSAAVEYRSVTTHWWSPIHISHLTVQEIAPKGDSKRLADHSEQTSSASESTPVTMLEVATLQTRQPLWQLLLSMGRGVELQIQEPVLNVRTVGNTTNVETTLEGAFGINSQDSSETFPVSVSVTDGTIRLLTPAMDASSIDAVALTGINGSYSSLKQAGTLPEFRLTANVDPAYRGGKESSTLASQQDRSVNPRIAASLDRLNTDFPLVPFDANQLRRMEQREEQQSIQVQFAPDPERSGVHHLNVEVSRLQVEDLGPLVRRLLPEFTLEGRISCLVQAHVLEQPGNSGIAGRLSFSGSKIFLRHDAWNATEAVRLESVTAGGVIAMAEDGLVVKELEVRSPILNLRGDGQVRVAAVDPVSALRTAANQSRGVDLSVMTDAQVLSAGEVTVKGRVDLAAVSEMLPRTLQLVDGVRLDEADVDFSCRIRQQPSEMLSRQISGPARPGFQWQLAAATSVLEGSRSGERFQLKAPLRVDAMGPFSLESTSVQKARLSGDFGDLSVDPIDLGYAVKGNINLGRMQETLKQLVVLPEIGLSEDIHAEGTVQWLKDGTLQMTAVHMEGEDLLLTSPQLQMRPWLSAVKMLQGQLRLKAQTATVKTLIAPWHDATWLGTGSRIQTVIDCHPEAIDVQALIEPVSGGQLSASQLGGPQLGEPQGTNFGNQVVGTGIVSGDGFQIHHARIRARLVADATGAEYSINQGSIELPGLQADVTGRLTIQQELLFADLVATTKYDLDVLLDNVLEIDRKLLTLNGRQQQPFVVKGCLTAWDEAELREQLAGMPPSNQSDTWKPLTISGSVRWDSGAFMGLPVSSGIVNATLAEGLLRTQPVSCQIGTGKLNAMVQYNMAQNQLQLAPGTRIENLELNEQFTREWLGYAIPMLGDSANVRGHLSCRVENCQYDLNNSNASQVDGQVTIHDANATVGPSGKSLISALSVLDRNASQNFQEVVLPAQTVQVQMRNGRIAHDRLVMQLGKYEITSRGVVSLDKRLDVSLTIPVSQDTAKITGSRQLMIPVTGTVSQPRPDTQGLLQNIGQQQIQNRVNNQLDRGLNKLFDKLR